MGCSESSDIKRGNVSMAHFLFGGGMGGIFVPSRRLSPRCLKKKCHCVFDIAPHIWIYSAMYHALNVKAKLTKLKSSKNIIYESS